MKGSVLLRGRIWWLRYYVDGRRVAESARTQDEATARRLLALRLQQRRTKRPCAACGELPEYGPRAFAVAWLKRIERRYGGRLPPVATLEMLQEQEVWARLKRRMTA